MLHEDGVLSMNLWNGDFITAREMLEDIRESFSGNVLKLPVEGKANTVALAARGQAMKKQLKKLTKRAEELNAKTGIEFPLFLKQIKKHNSWLSL
jgi:hypothetical protein